MFNILYTFVFLAILTVLETDLQHYTLLATFFSSPLLKFISIHELYKYIIFDILTYSTILTYDCLDPYFIKLIIVKMRHLYNNTIYRSLVDDHLQ